MTEQNSTGQPMEAEAGDGVIHAQPLPAPIPASSAGDIIQRHDPASLSPDAARAAIKGLAAHPSVMEALQTPSHPAHKPTQEWYRAMQRTAYGEASAPEQRDEESGATIAPASETLTFTVPDAPEGYADSLKEAQGFEADTELQQASAQVFHRVGLDTHAASTLRHVFNAEIERPLSVERRNEIHARTVGALTAKWGGTAAFDAKIAEINKFIREQSGDQFPVIQRALHGTSLGVSQFTVERIAEIMERRKSP